MKTSQAKSPSEDVVELPAAAPQPRESINRFSAKNSAGAHLKLQRILVPVDFSHESAKAMRYAVTLARQFDAAITLVHVVEPAYGPTGIADTGEPKPVPERERIARAKTKLGALGHKILGPCRIVETVIRSGLAFFEITEAAKCLDIDLIIIGTHGYTGPTHAVMGSTAEKVVRHAPCPVLVVRRHEHEFIE